MVANYITCDISDFLDIKLFESKDFFELIVKFAFNTLILFILVRLLYYPLTKRRDYMFTFMMIGTIVFLLCFILESVKLGTGMALGLFAIFGILRYRTTQISIKEMTYLFLVIGISVINALSSKKSSLAELLLTNFLVIGITWLVELFLFRKPVQMMIIDYEKIELIKPDKRKELLADLEDRTGLKIRRIEIGKLDFLRDKVRIQIFYLDKEQPLTEIEPDDGDD
jgi:hypothetical protein